MVLAAQPFKNSTTMFGKDQIWVLFVGHSISNEPKKWKS